MRGSHRPRRTAAVLLLTVVASGCGADASVDGAAETTRSTGSSTTAVLESTTTTAPSSTTTTVRTTTSTAPETTTSTGPPTTAGPSVGADSITVLQRNDPVPPGVRAQVETFEAGNGGSDPCPGPFPPGPGIGPLEWDPDPFGVEVGHVKAFCLPGFLPSTPIQVTFTAPSGSELVLEVPSLDERNADALIKGYEWFAENHLYWSVAPTAELGVYQATAGQDGRLATTRLEVRNAAEPVMRREGDYARTLGATLEFGLAGFTPGEVVDLHLYHLPASQIEAELVGQHVVGTFRYITTLSVQLDELGRTTLVLPTDLSDPPGGYGFFGATRSADFGYFDAEFALIPGE